MSEGMEYIQQAAQDEDGLRHKYNDLLASHERYRLMFDHIPLAYMSMNVNAIIIDSNNAFSELTGYEPQEVFGRPFSFFLFNKADIKYHLEVTFPDFRCSGRARSIPWKLRHKSGREIYVMVHGNARFDEFGEFVQTHCLIVDVTEEYRAKQECQKAESKAQLILDVISERVTFHDKQRNVLWANKIARNDSSKGCQDDCDCCVNHQSSCDKCPVIRVFNNQQPAFGELQNQGRVLQISAYPAFNHEGELDGVVQVARDITERRNLEREILRLSSSERQRIGHDLHDGLGQELTGLSFLASALANQLVGQDPALETIASKMVQSIGRARKRMYNVLQGLNHIPDGPDGLSRAFYSLAESVRELFGKQCVFHQRGELHIDDTVLCAHLFNIVNESVNNALKYSGCQQIEISIDANAERLVAEVKDDGCGMHNSTSRVGAMGLKIMQFRASIMNAELHIDSNDHGTSIRCEVPLATH
ncbi:PAS domain S-box protein [Shewanella avicenniae]|uniref:histidine kinase n=1 Tax=Shewanella avicenniae TaxID=2814294 RepID=A0ABX7QT99_9GAMM|nr:PAS domain S-box protein [Shewanella avicenniae]QSX34210.1 PAS domain S-box protein [Shewanella avicenniae]